MKLLVDKIEQALDLSEQIRVLVKEVLTDAEGFESCEEVVSCINEDTKSLIRMHNYLEDILCAVENINDVEDEEEDDVE